MKKYVIIAVIVAVVGLGVSVANKPERMQKKEGIVRESMMKKSEVDGEYDVTEGVPVAGMKNVLFFYASWCPTCRAADADITAKQSSIPSGLVIHKVDYLTQVNSRKSMA